MSCVFKTDFDCRAHRAVKVSQDGARLDTILKTLEGLQHPGVVVCRFAGKEGNTKNDILTLTAYARDDSQCKVVFVSVVSCIHEGYVVERLIEFRHLGCLYEHTVYF
jgi:hypothetical protein